MKFSLQSVCKKALAATCLLLGAASGYAQLVSDNVFLKGKYIEVGIAPIGAFGTSENVPEDGNYHPRTSAWIGSTPNLGFVSDPDMDGWEVGDPAYVGDYFLPGDPQEGWDLQINGVWNQAWRGAGGDGLMFRSSSGTPTLTGENIRIDTFGTKVHAIWEGSMATDLFIRQKTILDTNRVFFICEVLLKNTGTTTLEKIYYNRTVDPDNESAMEGGSSSTTTNTIDFLPEPGSNKCLVSAHGNSWPDLTYLGLGAVDCRAKAYIVPFNTLNPDRFGTDLEEIYNGETTGYLWEVGDERISDSGIGVVFNIGDLAPGDSTTIAYAYILRAADLDSAFSSLEKNWDVEGSTLSSSDSTVKCQGGTINVSISDGGLYEWGEWFPTTGLSETTGRTNVITVGTDTITYRVIGTTILCPESDTMYITVIPEIVESPGEDGAGTVCLFHEPINLLGYIGGDPLTDGVWSGPAITPSGFFNPTEAGIGTHELRYTRMVGECISYSTVMMTVYNDVDIDFDYTLTKGCSGDSVHFINNSEAGTYKWQYGDGSPYDSGVANPTHFYEEQGEYGAWLIVRTEAGCYDSLMGLVNTKHPIDAIFTMSTDSVCQKSNISFEDNSIGSLVNWAWDFGDGGTSATQSPTHHYTLAGTHTVRLIVTDDVPCSDTTYQTVYIDSIPTLELITDRTEVCNGERINMGLNFLYTAIGFTWDFGDGTSQEDGSGGTYHSYNQPGTYYIAASSHHPVCDDATAFDTVVVKPYPMVNLGSDTTICPNGVQVGLSSKSFLTDPDEIAWLWSTGSTNPIIRVIEPGTYTLTADWNGCKTSDEIEVKKDCYTDLPNSFTPNGDGNNDYFYPRQLLSRGVTEFSMVIFNRWGQKIFETRNIDGRGWDGRLNDKDQPTGVYIYQMSVLFKDNTAENYTGNVTLIR